MIVCEVCGARNEAGAQFCGNCGNYLAWSGEDAAAEGAESPLVATTDDAAGGRGEHDLRNGQTGQEAEVLAEREAAQQEQAEREEAEREAREAAAATARAEREARAAADAAALADRDARQAAAHHERVAGEAGRAEAERARALEEARAHEAAEEKAREEAAQVTADAEARARLEEEARNAAEARARAEADARAAEENRAQAEREARRAAEDKARAEAEAKARAAADARAKAEAEEQARREREARAAAAALAKPVPPAQPKSARAGSAKQPQADNHPMTPPAGTTGSTESVAPRRPQARKPGEAAPRRPAQPTPVEEEPAPRPGDLICGNCGAGNDASRKFCRRCGTSLEQATIVPELPWYRRLFQRKPKPAAAAGTRPIGRDHSRRSFARVRHVVYAVIGIAAVAGSLWFFRPQLEDALQALLDRIGGVDPAPVRSASVVASSSASGHPPDFTEDGFSNTSWQPAATGPAVGEFLLYEFAEPFRLVKVQIIPGAARDQAQFLTQGRPAELRVTVTDTAGETTDATWELEDEPNEQAISLGVNDVQTVRLVIASAYGVDDQKRVAIGEVEFYTRG